jgi:hypothetical protein
MDTGNKVIVQFNENPFILCLFAMYSLEMKKNNNDKKFPTSLPFFPLTTLAETQPFFIWPNVRERGGGVLSSNQAIFLFNFFKKWFYFTRSTKKKK